MPSYRLPARFHSYPPMLPSQFLDKANPLRTMNWMSESLIIQAQPVSADTPLNGLSTPIIDGKADEDEWAKAAVYTQADGTPLAGFEVTLDNENLYVKANAAQNAALPTKVGIYGLAPKSAYPNSVTVAAEGAKAALLNVAVSYAFLWDGGDTLAAYAAGADGWRAADTAPWRYAAG